MIKQATLPELQSCVVNFLLQKPFSNKIDVPGFLTYWGRWNSKTKLNQHIGINAL